MNPVSLKSEGLSKAAELVGQADDWLRRADGLGGGSEGARGFEAALAGELGKVFGAQRDAEQAIASYNAGDPGGSVERAAFMMAKAEADLRLAVQVRNKAVSAYQEVMNLQI